MPGKLFLELEFSQIVFDYLDKVEPLCYPNLSLGMYCASIRGTSLHSDEQDAAASFELRQQRF